MVCDKAGVGRCGYCYACVLCLYGDVGVSLLVSVALNDSEVLTYMNSSRSVFCIRSIADLSSRVTSRCLRVVRRARYVRASLAWRQCFECRCCDTRDLCSLHHSHTYRGRNATSAQCWADDWRTCLRQTVRCRWSTCVGMCNAWTKLWRRQGGLD